jgi:uncharacterized protein
MIVSLEFHYKEVAAGGRSVHLEGTIDLDALFRGRREVRSADDLEVVLTARPAMNRVRVEGDGKARVVLVCSRCLTDYEDTLTVPVLEQFSQHPEEQEADEDVHLVKEDRIDMRPYVEEAALLEIPFIPLCRDDCLGLCPECGANRNEQTCGCVRDTKDPRWLGLEDFFK